MGFDASDILAIPENSPHLLFFNIDKVEDDYKTLARIWHPDLNSDPQATAVLQHIHLLLQAAHSAKANGTWGYGSSLTVKTQKGMVYHPYLTMKPFELGEIYICADQVIFATRREHDDLCRRFLETTKTFKFADAKMEAEFKTALPQRVHTVANADRAFTFVRKDPENIRVQDILDHETMDPRHIAWILSRAYNMCCWLNFSGLMHLDISPESFYVNPATHSGALLGGWFYAKSPFDAKALAAPARTAHYAGMDANRAHLSMVKQMGRKMFGLSSIVAMKGAKTVPEYLRKWLTAPASADPIEEYKQWHTTLEKTFGKRRFTIYPLTRDQIYSS